MTEQFPVVGLGLTDSARGRASSPDGLLVDACHPAKIDVASAVKKLLQPAKPYNKSFASR
jgi:hypothetical protein